MDHRVSKDMISSGMTPSGQRSQADLGRTQYGSAPSPDSLMDAYKAIYQNVDEKMNPMNLGKSKRTLKQKQDARSKKQVQQGNMPTGASKGARGADQGKVGQVDDGMGSNSETTTKNKNNNKQSKGFGDSFDLLAAYQSMYIDSFEEGKIPAGLQAYLDKKKGKKGGDDEDHGDEKKGKKGKKSKGGKPDFLDLDKDGDKKESMKKASKEMKEENVDEAVVTGSILAGLAAKKALAGLATKALAKKALVGATQMAMKKGATKAAASKLVGKVGAKKAAGMVAKKAVTGTGKAMVKNPLNTMVGASMVMPQGGGGGAPAQPKPPKLYSDVDLFDIVKGVLVSEGLDEDTATKVMIELPTLTNEEIIEIEDEVNSMSEQQLNELIAPAVALGARKLASTAAKRGLGTAVKKGAAMAGKALAGKTGVKAVAMGAKKIATKAKPIAKKVGGALLGTTTAGRITRGIGAAALLRKDAYDKGRKSAQGDGSGLIRTSGFSNYDPNF